MFKRSILSHSIALALVVPGVAIADLEDYVEISGELKNESAFLSQSGQFNGEATSTTDTSTHHNRFFKFQNQARVFLNGEIGEESSWHGELNVIHDSKGVNDNYEGHVINSQHDWLRELYVDTTIGEETEVRIGKQQVVWGTADGIKLLDIINPTDFRELNQNAMEDSRIPIWMATVETPVGDSGNLQFVIAESEENKIPGLNASGDQGHAFILKGVDSITGKVNGFLNVAPALSLVANSFSLAAFGGFFDLDNSGGASAPDAAANGLSGFGNLSVSGFGGATQLVIDPDASIAGGTGFSGDEQIRTAAGAGTPVAGGFLLNELAQRAGNFGFPATNNNNDVTSLTEAAYSAVGANSAFEYMANATFATFNTFAGAGGAGGVAGFNSVYKKDYDKGANAGFRYKANLDSGLNFSLNYFYHYDSNPKVSMSWQDSVTGERLQTQLATHAPDPLVGLVPDQGTNITSSAAIPTTFTGAGTDVSVLLKSPSTGAYYGMFNFNPNGVGTAGAAPVMSANRAQLVFTEELERIHSLGGSFDMALDGASIPTVIRGEVLYDRDVNVPVVDKLRLAVGDLENALKPEKADFFKYVVGVDFTVFTNMLWSTQFIQFRNLDFQEESRTCTTQTAVSFDCSRYTAEPATVHMSNGLQKGEENKEFVSIFFSKPFGAEQQHRWNNITIFEDTGGRWNRFDVEYQFRDEIIGSFEWNHYWGEDDSIFGQLNNSSNIQVGVKYIF